MGKTKISWTDESSNPIRAESIALQLKNGKPKRGWHCTKVSQGCKNCYAERLNKRFGTGLSYAVISSSAVKTVLDENELKRWRRIKPGRKVFVCDMTDLFGEHVTDEQINYVFAAMALNPHVTFQVLTKRPKRMLEYMRGLEKDDLTVLKAMQGLADKWGLDFTWSSLNMLTVDVSYDDEDGGIDTVSLFVPLPNVWLGVSVENQEAADERIPHLLCAPAAVRFLSCEPLLERVIIPEVFLKKLNFDGRDWNYPDNAGMIDWVICGGESGPHYREMNLDWARSLRDQCVAADVSFFYKQSSGYRSEMNPLLDGVEWRQFPKVNI